MQEFIAFLKELRKKKKLSQRKLAELSRVSQCYLSHLENGKRNNPPSPEILKKLATALEADYYLLMEKAGYVSYSSDEFTLTAEEGNSTTLYKYPVNDLKFYLEENSNPTFFGEYLLNEKDQHFIKNMISLYLAAKAE